MIELRLERERFGPAEVVRGWVLVHAELYPRVLEVTIALRERTADFEESALEGRTGPLHQGPLAAGTAVPFALQLPPNPLPPYRSRWGELFWLAEAKADIPNARDVVARKRIWVIPPEVADWQLTGEGAGGDFERLMPAKLAEWSAAPDAFGNRPPTAPGNE